MRDYRLDFVAAGSTGIARPTGRLDVETAGAFKKRFLAAAERSGLRDFVVDMAGVEYVDSSGLGVLIACQKWAGGHGGEVRLARLQSPVRIVFEITKAHRVFDIFDDVDAAARGFRPGSSSA
jgi:anti-sigma B factor antagonist